MKEVSLINFSLNSKQLMFDGTKQLNISAVDGFNKQKIGSKGIEIMAPNGIELKGICMYNGVPYQTIGNQFSIAKDSPNVKLYYHNLLQLINGGRGKNNVKATIQPFSIQLNLTRDFTLYKVNNIHQINKHRVYAPFGFDLYINNVCYSNCVKALRYFVNKIDSYWSKPMRLEWNDMYDYESTEEYTYWNNSRYFNVNDKIELKFYEQR